LVNRMNQSKKGATAFKLAILWFAILILGSFWLTVRANSDPVGLAVVPQVPRAGQPIIATFKLNNPSSSELVTEYQFYANGQLLKEGVTTISPGSVKIYKYAYENPLQVGERLNFMVNTESELGNHERVVSSPPYPPQVWSSFVSFSSFSTLVMNSMSSMTYYQSTFGSNIGFNLGIIISIVLIALLIFLELSQPIVGSRTIAAFGQIRVGLSTVTWTLFIIFAGIVYTNLVMILSS